MTQQVINIGAAANDGTGDPLRTSFSKINANFTELYSKDAAGSNLDISENEIAATNSNGNIELVPNGSGHISVVDDHIIITTSRTPSTTGTTGDKAGSIGWDSNNIYICTANYDGSTIIWKTIPSNTGQGLTISNGAITGTVTNGNITLTPNGTGDVVLSADTVTIGDAAAAATLTTNGAGDLTISTNSGTNSGTIAITNGANGNITVAPNGTGRTVASRLYLNAGTATANTAPIKLASGTLLSAAEAGTLEYDGNLFYTTRTSTAGRGLLENYNIARLYANGSAIGPAAADVFTTASHTLTTGASYELEVDLYFLKTTSDFVTFSLVFSNGPVNCNAFYQGTPATGMATVGSSVTAGVVAQTSTTISLPATGVLTTGANHFFRIKAAFDANATTGGTVKLQVTNNSGTLTPLRNSYIKYRRLPLINTGAFS